MKFSAAFIALVPLVYAVAVPVAERDLITVAPRNQGDVFVCVDDGFTGPCGHFSGTSGECVNFPAPFNDTISSFGPDSGQVCFIYVDANCSGESLGPISNSGFPHLGEDPRFQDSISSFKCFFG